MAPVGPNIAFAGLTAAGKTTHARRLAHALGYEYVSATQILLDVLAIDHAAERVWFARAAEIEVARKGDQADIELEHRLQSMAASRHSLVIDSWAMAWIGSDPLIRIWIESDLPSRTRKCFVSQGEAAELNLQHCEALVRQKDDWTRRSFVRRHDFDLYSDRSRYDVELCNSHLIATATPDAANEGIEIFSLVVLDVVQDFLRHGAVSDETWERWPMEILRAGSRVRSHSE